jgi:hypothetical protein
LFRETGGVYRRKTTGQPLKRTAAVSAVIEIAKEIMQNAPHTFSASVIATQQAELYVGKQERASNCYEKKKVDISSTSFNKLINLCVNSNCVTFFIIIRVMLLFFSEVMSYFKAATSVFQNKRFLPEY